MKLKKALKIFNELKPSLCKSHKDITFNLCKTEFEAINTILNALETRLKPECKHLNTSEVTRTIDTYPVFQCDDCNRYL